MLVLVALRLCKYSGRLGFSVTRTSARTVRKYRTLSTSQSSHIPIGANPSLECVVPSASPSCSCTCSNGILFNQTLTATPPTGSSTHPDTCQADKDQCLQREQQLSAQITDAQQARKECEEKSTTEMNGAQQKYLEREQDLLAQLNEAQQANVNCQQKALTDLNDAKEAHTKREKELSAQLTQCQKNVFTYDGCYVIVRAGY